MPLRLPAQAQLAPYSQVVHHGSRGVLGDLELLAEAVLSLVTPVRPRVGYRRGADGTTDHVTVVCRLTLDVASVVQVLGARVTRFTLTTLVIAVRVSSAVDVTVVVDAGILSVVVGTVILAVTLVVVAASLVVTVVVVVVVVVGLGCAAGRALRAGSAGAGALPCGGSATAGRVRRRWEVLPLPPG